MIETGTVWFGNWCVCVCVGVCVCVCVCVRVWRGAWSTKFFVVSFVEGDHSALVEFFSWKGEVAQVISVLAPFALNPSVIVHKNENHPFLYISFLHLISNQLTCSITGYSMLSRYSYKPSPGSKILLDHSNSK